MGKKTSQIHLSPQEKKMNFVTYNSLETYYFYPLFLPKISSAFLSTLIVCIANNSYNHHNDKSLRR